MGSIRETGDFLVVQPTQFVVPAGQLELASNPPLIFQGLICKPRRLNRRLILVAPLRSALAQPHSPGIVVAVPATPRNAVRGTLTAETLRRSLWAFPVSISKGVLRLNSGRVSCSHVSVLLQPI